MFRRAEVRVEGELAGLLVEGEDGFLFQYDEAYLVRPGARPISLSMPLRADPYTDKRMLPFFDGLIPEGWLLEIAQSTWKIDPRDRMGLLLACCRHCIGVVEILPAPGDGP